MYADDASISLSSDSVPDINKSVNSDHIRQNIRMELNKLSLSTSPNKNYPHWGRKYVEG